MACIYNELVATKPPISICQNEASQYAYSRVPRDCQQCNCLRIEVPDGGPTILNDGTIIYKKVGWEPPLNIDGYERDKENRWVFHPLWPECDTRNAEAILAGSCQCLQIKMTCDGQPVSLERCQECRATRT
jgi:hypothetical protein